MLRRASLLGLVLLFAGTGAHAERALLSGTLGQWLDVAVAPELVDKLGKHPRFKNTRIKFATLENGRRVVDNELSYAVHRELGHRILRNGSNDIEWQQSKQSCVSMPRRAYVLALEISSRGANHRVDLSVLDPDEGIYVGGLSFSWEGRLLASEKKALDRRTKSVALGTRANPIHVADSEQLASAADQQMQCTLRGGLDGAVFFAEPGRAETHVFWNRLEQVAALRPGMVLAGSEATAAWIATTEVTPIEGRVHELVILVAPRENAEQMQRVASLYVTGIRRHARGPEKQEARELQEPVEPSVRDQVLISLDLADENPQSCGKRGDEVCALLQLQLGEEASVFVFGTHDGQVAAASCESRERAPGHYQFRVKLHPDKASTGRPDGAFYVLASRNDRALNTVAAQIAERSNKCSGSRRTADLETLVQLVERHARDIEWRAVHLGMEGDTVASL